MVEMCGGTPEVLRSNSLALKGGQSGKGKPVGGGESDDEGSDKPSTPGLCRDLLCTDDVRR